MKIHQTITLDSEIVEQLKEVDNASGLINSLLIEHFKISMLDLNNMSIEQLQDKLRKIQRKKEITKELEGLQ